MEVEQPFNFLRTVRVEVVNGNSFHLVLDIAHTETVSDRRIEIHRFERGFALFFGRARVECAHIVETVGELYDDNADILAHCHKDFADIFGVLFLF